jgi:acetyl-CoA C-acetyltransferase
MSGCIVGWAHGKFGKREGLDLEALIAEVAVQALADANVAPAEVDEIYVGHFGGGFVKQDFPASLVFQAASGRTFTGPAFIRSIRVTVPTADYINVSVTAQGAGSLTLA